MMYVKRNDVGKIIAVSEISGRGFEEELDDEDQDLTYFLSQIQNSAHGSIKNALSDSDHAIARVTEDLIQLLIKKKIIRFTDLPEAVQEKLLVREKLRTHLRGEDSSLLDDLGSI